MLSGTSGYGRACEVHEDCDIEVEAMTGANAGKLGRLLKMAVGVACCSAIALASASQAYAAEHHPTGAFARFADCPLANSHTELCLDGVTESGEITMGHKTVPITNPITLQGGLYELKEEELELIAPEDGKTLSKSPQSVPGGLLGVVAPEILPGFLRTLLNETIEKGATGVTATTELAAPASAIRLNLNHLIEGEGTVFTLPVKVKLSNPFLGEHCYIGSNAHPIDLVLTDGRTSPPPPNSPISGKVGEIEFLEEDTITEIKDNTLVDNSFAVPAAEGCGGLLSLLIDPAVDAEIGLPSAAGHNAAIMNGTQYEAIASAVTASE